MSFSDLPCQSHSDTTSSAILSKKVSAKLLSLNDNVEHFLSATDYVNAFTQYLTTLNICSEVCNLVAEQCSRTANTYALQGLFNIFKMHRFKDYTSEESTVAFEKIIKELSYVEILISSHFVRLGTFGNLNSAGEMIAVCHIESKKKYMMKIYNKLDLLENNEFSNVVTEFKITKSMASSELQNLEFSFQSEFHLYFLFEFVEGDIMTLQGTSGRLTTEKICYYLPQIMWAITRLHSWGYSHRDIQPKNILLTSSGTLKLANFGNAGKLCNGYSVVQNNQNIVLSEFSAPELIQAVLDARECNISVQVDKGCDLWSLGVLIYKFYFGYVPFGDWEDENTLHRILKFQKTVLFSEKVPEDLSRLMRGLIQQPENRFNTTHIENNVYYKNYCSEKSIENIFNQYPFKPIIPDLQDTTDTVEFSPVALSVSELNVWPIANFRFLPLSYKEYSNYTKFSVTGAMNDEILAALTCFRELTSLTDNTLMQIFKSPVMKQLKLPLHKDYGINIPHVNNVLFVDVMDTLNELYYFLKYISFAVKRMFSLGKKYNDSTAWVENLIEGLKESIETVGKIPYIKIKNIVSRFDYIDTCYLVIKKLEAIKSGEWNLLGEMIETILKSYLKLLSEILRDFHCNINISLDCILKKDLKKYKIADGIICFLNFITAELLEEKERMNGNELTTRVKYFEKMYQQNFEKVVREIQKFNRCVFFIVRELTDIKKYHEKMSERSSKLLPSRKGRHNNRSDLDETHSSTSSFTKSGEEVIVPKEDSDISISKELSHHNIEDEEESCNQSAKSSSNDDNIYHFINSDSVMSDTLEVPQDEQPKESETEVTVTDSDNVSNTCFYTVDIATSELSEENETKGHNVSSKDSKESSSSSSKEEKTEESSNAEEKGSEQSQVSEEGAFKEQFSTIEMNRSEQFSNSVSEKTKPKQFCTSKQEQLKNISVTGSSSEKSLVAEKYKEKELIPQKTKVTKEEYSSDVQSISVKGKSVSKPVAIEQNIKRRKEKRKYALKQSNTKQFSAIQTDKREESILAEKPKKSSDEKVEMKLTQLPMKEYSEKSSQHIGTEVSGMHKIFETKKTVSKPCDEKYATKDIHPSEEEHVGELCKTEGEEHKLITVEEKQTDQFTTQSAIQKEINTEISTKTDVEIEHLSSIIVEDKSKHFIFDNDSVTNERKTEQLSVTKIGKMVSEERMQVTVNNESKLAEGDTRLISPPAKDECKRLEVFVEGDICHVTTAGYDTTKDLLSEKTESKCPFEVKKVLEKEQLTIGKEKMQSIDTEKTEQTESLTLQDIKEQDTIVAQSALVDDKSGCIPVVEIDKNRKTRKQQQVEMKKSAAEQTGTKQFFVTKENTTEQFPLSKKPKKLSDRKTETKQLHPFKKKYSEKLTTTKQKPSQHTGSEVCGEQVTSTKKKICKKLSADEKDATKDIHVSEEHAGDLYKWGDGKPELISEEDKQINQFTIPTEVGEEIQTEKSFETEEEETEHSSSSTMRNKSKHAVGNEIFGTQFSVNEEGKYLQFYVSETDQSDYLQAPEEEGITEPFISHVDKSNQSCLVEEDINQSFKEYQTKKSSTEPEKGEFLPVMRRDHMKQYSSSEMDIVKAETSVYRHSEEMKTSEEKSRIKQTASTERLSEKPEKSFSSSDESFSEISFLSNKTVTKDHASKQVVGASEKTTKEDSSFINQTPKGEKLFSTVTMVDRACNTIDTFDSDYLRGADCSFNITMLMKADENELMNLYWMYTSATEESIRTLISVQKKIQYFEKKIREINQQLETKLGEIEQTGSISKQDIRKEVVDLPHKEKFRKSDPIQKRHIFPYKEMNLQKKLTFNVIKYNWRPINKTVGIETEVPVKLKKPIAVASQTSRASALATHRMFLPFFDVTKANCTVCRKLIMSKEKRMECSKCNIITHEMCLLFVSTCPYVGCDIIRQKSAYSKATCGYLQIRRSEHIETFFTVMVGQNITFYDCNVSSRRRFSVSPIEEFLSFCSDCDVVLNPMSTENNNCFEMKFLENGCVRNSFYVIAEAPLQKHMWFSQIVKAASSEFFDYRSDNTGAPGSSLSFPFPETGKLIYPDEIKFITAVRYRVNDIVLIRDVTFVICCYEGLFTFDASNSEDIVELKGLNNVTKLTYLSAPYTYSYAIAETCITRKRNMVQINSKALYDIVGMQNNGNFFISAEPIKNLKHTVSDFIVSTDQDIIVAAARTTVLVMYLSQDGDVEAMKAITFNSFVRCLNFIEEDTAIGVYAGAFHKIKFPKNSKLTASSLITHKESSSKLVRIASSDPHSFMRIQSIYRRDHFEYFIIVGRKIFLCLDNPNFGIKRTIEGIFGGVIHSEHFDDILRIIDCDKITYYDISRVNNEQNVAAITLSSADILQKLNFKDAYNVFGGSGRFGEPTILVSFKDGITQIANLDNYSILINARQIMYATLREVADTLPEKLNLNPMPDVVKSNEDESDEEEGAVGYSFPEENIEATEELISRLEEKDEIPQRVLYESLQQRKNRR